MTTQHPAQVLARVPGLGGKHPCDVVGEDETRFALAYTFLAAFDAEETVYFARRKRRCVPCDQPSEERV